LHVYEVAGRGKDKRCSLQALCAGCAQAAQQLWARVGGGAGLPAHLAALRAYLLLGRGDLFQGFLAQARAPMNSNPNPITPSFR